MLYCGPMLGKIKGGAKQVNELRKLRSQAKDLQKKLAEITESEEKDGMRVKVSGDQRIAYLEIDGESREDLVKLINSALDGVQKRAAKQMMQEEGLSGLLGGLGQ